MATWTKTYQHIRELAREHNIVVDREDPVNKFADAINRLSGGETEDKEFRDLVVELAKAEVISHRQMHTFVLARHRELDAAKAEGAAQQLTDIAEKIETGLNNSDIEAGTRAIAEGVEEVERIVTGLQDLKDNKDWSDIVEYANSVARRARDFLMLRERAERGDPEAALRVLKKVPDVPPEEGDKMPGCLEERNEKRANALDDLAKADQDDDLI